MNRDEMKGGTFSLSLSLSLARLFVRACQRYDYVNINFLSTYVNNLLSTTAPVSYIRRPLSVNVFPV